MDPYTLLGLAPNADVNAVKRAFRRLAMRWHPDRNPDPAALEHFKLLRAAHDHLVAMLENDFEAEQPHADDGSQGPEPAAEAHPTDTSDAAAPSSMRGPDRIQDIRLELEDAFFGCERAVEFDVLSDCAVCDGSGREPLPFSQLCADCHGTGRVRSATGLAKCAACGGQGYTRERSCSHCGGGGAIRTSRTLSVKIPPGLLDGDWLRVAGAGEPAQDPHGTPGDLRLRLSLAPHPLYALQGRNLVIDRPMSAFRMLIGGEIDVPVPGGVETVTIEPGEPCTREMRVPHAGFPGRRGEARGDLLIRLRPVFPSLADDRLHKMLVSLERVLASDPARHLSPVDNWEVRWLGEAHRP